MHIGYTNNRIEKMAANTNKKKVPKIDRLTEKPDKKSKEEQILHIMSRVPLMEKNDLERLAKFIYDIAPSSIVETNGGTIVKLKNLTEELIEKIYEFI